VENPIRKFGGATGSKDPKVVDGSGGIFSAPLSSTHARDDVLGVLGISIATNSPPQKTFLD